MTIQIRHATTADAQAAAGLLSEGLARRTPQEIADLLDAGGACLLAFRDGALVGVATALVTDDIAQALPPGQDHLADALALPRPTGLLKSIVVTHAARCHGNLDPANNLDAFLPPAQTSLGQRSGRQPPLAPCRA